MAIADNIVVLSENGQSIVSRYYPFFLAKTTQANILLSDVDKSEMTRDYITFVGSINRGKGLCDVINLVKYQIESKSEIMFSVKVITSSAVDIESIVSPEFADYLSISSIPNLTDEQIAEAICNSIAVLSTHSTGTQSGVLPLAAGYGTPVISRRISAATQFANYGVILVPKDGDGEAWYNACCEVKSNLRLYQQRARNGFDEKFSEKQFLSYYSELFGDMS